MAKINKFSFFIDLHARDEVRNLRREVEVAARERAGAHVECTRDPEVPSERDGADEVRLDLQRIDAFRREIAVNGRCALRAQVAREDDAVALGGGLHRRPVPGHRPLAVARLARPGQGCRRNGKST